MDLPTVWFMIIAFLFAGFFFLEGFDYGAGMLLPFLSGKEESKRMILHALGGVWDGNEVWLITAGAALFAVFPQWYATLFSGIYPVLFLILLALIVRGVGFRFRGEMEHPAWRGFWEWMIFIGSLLLAFLWGVIVGNLLRGVPMNEHRIYAGGLADLFSPYCLLAGVLFIALFLLHGAMFLILRVSGELLETLRSRLSGIYVFAVMAMCVFLLASFIEIHFFDTQRVRILAAVAGVALALEGFWLKKNGSFVFWMNGLVIVLMGAGAFAYLYPRVLISSLNPAWNLTVWNASASAYSLKVSSGVALIFIPIVLVYQGWTYWVLRKRIGNDEIPY